MTHQLSATGGLAKLCYRVNLIHDRLTEKRHERTSPANWKIALLKKEREKFRMLRRHLPVYLPGASLASPLRWFLKQLACVRSDGFLAYAEDKMRNVFARKRFGQFAEFPQPERMRLIRENLFIDESFYMSVPYRIVGCGALRERSNSHVC